MFMFLSEREKNLDDVLKMDTFPSRAGRFTKFHKETNSQRQLLLFFDRLIKPVGELTELLGSVLRFFL